MSGGDDWDPRDRARLDALAREETPSAELEERVVVALRERGLLGGRRRGAWPWAAAAALAGLVLGVALGRATLGGRERAPAPGRSFALLLYPGEAAMESGAAERARVDEYRRWARGLAAHGQLVSGEKLKAPVRMLSAAAGAGQPEEGRLLGFFLLRATSMEEAEAIARTCPHLRHGGTIALREVDPT
jgi:hypothetical protein